LKHHKSPFKWRHFEPTIILLCVHWYCRYTLSYRDLEEMMRGRVRLIVEERLRESDQGSLFVNGMATRHNCAA
jgi:transposase-like protein